MTSNPYPIRIKKAIKIKLFFSIIYIMLSLLIFIIPFVFTNMVIKEIKSDGHFNKELEKESNDILFISSIILITIVIIFSLFIIIEAVYHFLYLKSIEYYFDKKNIVLKEGVISRSEKTIPYNNIQNIIVTQTFFQKIMNICNIFIQTARENIYSTGMTIPAIDKSDAEKILNIIYEKIK